MNSTLILVVCLLPAAVFVLWPLFSNDSEEVEPPPQPDSSSSLEERKKAAYAALKEAEFDRRTGKLSEEDYDKLVARYKSQALEAIAALDRRQGGAVSAPAADATPQVRFCAQCGTKIPSGAKFCAGCGSKLAA
jgi:hypothetical protein